MQIVEKHIDQDRVRLPSPLFSQVNQDFFQGPRPFVDTGAGQGVKNIGQGRNPPENMRLLADQTLVIAVSIPAFVVLQGDGRSRA